MASLRAQIPLIDTFGSRFTPENFEAVAPATVHLIAEAIYFSVGGRDDLSCVPAYSPDLPVGTVYQDGGELKIAKGPITIGAFTVTNADWEENATRTISLLSNAICIQALGATSGAVITSIESAPEPTDSTEDGSALNEPAQPARWRSVIADSDSWRSDTKEPPRTHAPFPGTALRSEPGVAPFLAFEE